MTKALLPAFPQKSPSVVGRLVVLSTVYYHREGQEPVCVENHFYQSVHEDEQHYQREYVLGGDWGEPDTGWVNTPSVLMVKNLSASGQNSIVDLSFTDEGTPKAHVSLPPGRSTTLAVAEGGGSQDAM